MRKGNGIYRPQRELIREMLMLNRLVARPADLPPRRVMATTPCLPANLRLIATLEPSRRLTRVERGPEGLIHVRSQLVAKFRTEDVS